MLESRSNVVKKSTLVASLRLMTTPERIFKVNVLYTIILLICILLHLDSETRADTSFSG